MPVKKETRAWEGREEKMHDHDGVKTGRYSNIPQLAKFFELKEAQKAASKAAQEKRDELIARLNLTHEEASKRQEYQELNNESMRLYREVQSMAHWVIKTNLEQFSLEDMEVTGIFLKDGYGEEEAGRATMLLSEICGLRYEGLAKKLGLNPRELRLQILVEKDDKRIGHIDCDGRFHYESAPDLRTCIGWAVVTDLGREQLLNYDLDQETEALARSIRSAPPLDEEEEVLKAFFFDGDFARQIQVTMGYKKGSRFADGYCGVKNTFWQVGTLTIRGKKHPGFTFGY